MFRYISFSVAVEGSARYHREVVFYFILFFPWGIVKNAESARLVVSGWRGGIFGRFSLGDRIHQGQRFPDFQNAQAKM